MARQMIVTILHCRECLAFRESGAEGAHCARNKMVFGTHPVDKAAPGWCPLRKMALILEYRGS